jgi:CrcB protein
VALLYERGEIGLAALYVLLSVVLSIGGLFGGLALVRSLT